MLSRVREMRPSYNNDERIASSTSVSSFKLLYYQVLAALFSGTGYFVDMAFVNSSWTEDHMKHMWRGAILASTGGVTHVFTCPYAYPFDREECDVTEI
jgi:H+/Cl- antiporter ClcA